MANNDMVANMIMALILGMVLGAGIMKSVEPDYSDMAWYEHP